MGRFHMLTLIPEKQDPAPAMERGSVRYSSCRCQATISTMASQSRLHRIPPNCPIPPMSETPNPTEVTMFVEKSAFFRVIHADGTLCALSPTGNVCLTFYKDHAPLPKEMVEGVDVDALPRGRFERSAMSARAMIARSRRKS